MVEKKINNVEKELNEVKSDIKIIMNDINYIKKIFDGNGHEGLINRVDKNTEFRLKFEGMEEKKENWLGNGWVLAVFITGLNIVMYFIK